MRAQANAVCTSLAYIGEIKAKLRYDPLGRLHEVTGYVSGVSQGPTRCCQSNRNLSPICAAFPYPIWP